MPRHYKKNHSGHCTLLTWHSLVEFLDPWNRGTRDECDKIYAHHITIDPDIGKAYVYNHPNDTGPSTTLSLVDSDCDGQHYFELCYNTGPVHVVLAIDADFPI